jgi:hypothetical protein
MIIDVRDYRLLPGKLAPLVERFEALFMDEQERLGARMLGAFRDADDPDRFLWLRGMPDLETRQRVLTAFYAEGEMWRQHREEVNTWFIDTDDVLLMHPVSEWSAPATGPSTVAMYSCIRKQPVPPDEAAEVQRAVPAAIAAAGGRMLVTLETDRAENNYPKHPIRTGEYGFLWFATFAAPAQIEVAGVVQRRLIPLARSRMR